MRGDFENVLERCFGPDPDPSPQSKLPNLPYMGYTSVTHVHSWSTGERHGVPYWECVSGCSAMRSEPPPE